MINNHLPEFCEKKLDNLSERLNVLCKEGFYKDIAYELGCIYKDQQKVLHRRYFGSPDLVARKESIWRIYSMTKPIVSILALALVDEGKLRLFDHVARFLPNYKEPKILISKGKNQEYVNAKSPMTIFHLLTHTSGLSYGFLNGGVAKLYRQEEVHFNGLVSLEDEVKKISKLPLISEPGSKWHYSVATDVLGHILELVSGYPLPELLKKYVFSKLGMNEIGFDVPSNKLNNLMPCFGKKDIFDSFPSERASDIFSNNPKLEEIKTLKSYPTNAEGKFYRGGHGLFSTISNYGLFAASMLNGAKGILSRKSMDLLLKDHTQSSMKPLTINPVLSKPTEGLQGYGFGFGVRIRGKGNLALSIGTEGEFGWAGAADTFFLVDPNENFYAIFMAQNIEQPGGPSLFKQLIYSALK